MSVDYVRRSIVVLAALAVWGVFSGCTPTGMQADPSKAAIEARWTLLNSADDKDEFTRAQAIQALGETLGADCGNIYVQALHDKSPAVRFAAAMVVGDLKYEPAKTLLVKMAQDKNVEPDRRVYPGVVYALYRMGINDYVKDFGKLLMDPEDEVRAVVVQVMGKMGNEQAIEPLKALRGAEQPAKVDIQLTESLAMLGDEKSIALLEAQSKSIFLDERVTAILALGKLRDRRAVYLLREMTGGDEKVLVRLAAAGALAELGTYDDGGYKLCVETAEAPNKVLRASFGPGGAIDPEMVSKAQTLATRSLGFMGNVAAVDVLLPILKSADGQPRVAAAMSILRLLPAYAKAPAYGGSAPTVLTTQPETIPTTTPAVIPSTKPVTIPGTKPAPSTTPATKPTPATTPATTPSTTSTSKPAPATFPTTPPATTRPKLITPGAKD